MQQAISNAGIKQKADGTQEIPASRRRDGTTRAPIRVRPGYVPTEDVVKYRPPRSREIISPAESIASPVATKGVKSKTIPIAGTIPMAAIAAATTTSPGNDPHASKSSKSSWAESGWRGGDDGPSRWARKEVTEVLKVNTPSAQKIVNSSTQIRQSPAEEPPIVSLKAGPYQKDAQGSSKKRADSSKDELQGLEDKLDKVQLSST